jgi:mevalonate kinase
MFFKYYTERMLILRYGIGSSHAKIILIGDHSVVYGYPAIALPLPGVALTVHMQERPTGFGQILHSRYYDGPLDRALAELDGMKQLIERLLQYFEAYQLNFEMTIHSALPAERGMGSSAATGIAIIRAIFDFFKRPIAHNALLKWADFSEGLIHGTPSGLDAATVSANTPIWFIKGQLPQQVAINTSGYLVIADSGIKGRTGAAVALVRQHVTDDPTHFKPLLQQLGQLTTQVKTELTTGDLKQLGQHLNLAQRNLKELGVSSAALDQLIATARQHGALGAKLTGGGQGGCMIAICADKASANNLATQLKAAGAIETWIQALTEISNS